LVVSPASLVVFEDASNIEIKSGVQMRGSRKAGELTRARRREDKTLYVCQICILHYLLVPASLLNLGFER
jgi:hypothetical protein